MNNDRTWAEVSLNNIAHNYNAFRQMCGAATTVMSVIKADGYGHGATALGLHLQQLDCGFFGVASLDEAIELCRAGIVKPTLVLGYTHSERFAEAFAHPNIRLTVFDFDSAKRLSEAAVANGASINIHIKLDTGMTRLGLNVDEAAGAIARIRKLPKLFVEGLFTHLATADEADPSYTEQQFAQFTRIADQAGRIPYKHVCNSAGTMMFPHMRLDMVRVGISLYGCYPSEETDKSRLALKPAMRFMTRVVRMNSVPAGVSVSYGRTFTTTRTSKLATIPVGYADGLSRVMSEAHVLINGKEAPIVGRICMDQCVVDVTDVGSVRVLDEVEIYGERLPVEKLAASMGTINYEVLCMVGRRVPRIYTSGGKTIEERNSLLDQKGV